MRANSPRRWRRSSGPTANIARRWERAERPRAGGALRARALLGLGREEEALSQAEWASETARRRGMHWQLPPALLTLAKARARSGTAGVNEALEEAIEIATSRGHEMALERILKERSALSAA